MSHSLSHAQVLHLMLLGSYTPFTAIFWAGKQKLGCLSVGGTRPSDKALPRTQEQSDWELCRRDLNLWLSSYRTNHDLLTQCGLEYRMPNWENCPEIQNKANLLHEKKKDVEKILIGNIVLQFSQPTSSLFLSRIFSRCLWSWWLFPADKWKGYLSILGNSTLNSGELYKKTKTHYLGIRMT